ncbi:hypothetical protein [Archangium lansingense]|uniref:Knr4/Smi1-like domain-containing protein n=1 Tax=Archangium lansingense TaxID=2995310 RepID=A0ABT4ANT3_9BACT|nr:hypothetical protein [Archangium lansinium]MCY1083358.1 hypothetical protein [Archangium lansinium]
MSKRASQERFRELLNDVAGWAAGFGGRLVLGPPVPDEDIALLPELLGLPVPPGGEVLPDGLRDFWGLCAFARVEVPDAEEEGGWRTLPANFRVYSPDEVLDATRWVRIPDDVTLGNRRITTAHLFALAVSDVLPRDAQWCVAAAQGSLPGPVIVHNHMDELQWARFQDTGRYVGEGESAGVFASFLEWFEHYVRHVRALRPEALYPDGVTYSA